MLVLSLFPGIGMLDHAFEREGFTVVRGPDPLWGGDVRRFHPPDGRFDGIIGGPPCQTFSPIGNVNKARYGDDCVMPDLIPEFRRCILEADPAWWIMENSPYAYAPLEPCHRFELDNEWFGEAQGRRRAFWTNLEIGPLIHAELPALLPVDAGSERTVSSKGAVDWKGSRSKEPTRPVPEMLRLQGFPEDWIGHQPWTVQAMRKMVGNGVPLLMGLALARAIKLWLANGEDEG